MSRDRAIGPSWSARRRPWREASFVALDFETTGLDVARDDVISFGAVPIEAGRIAMARSTYQLVRPRLPPSRESVVVHGLRWQDVVDAPDLHHTRRALREALGGRFLVTWYAPIENAFLAKLFDGRPRERSWGRRNVDVRGLAIAAGVGSGGPISLTAVAERLRVPIADPHHALDDALVTAQLFLMLATRLASDQRGTVRHLLRAGRSTTSGA